MAVVMAVFVFALMWGFITASDSRPKVCVGNLLPVTSAVAVRTNRCIIATRYATEVAATRFPNISWDYIRDINLIDTHGYPFHAASLARQQIEVGCANGAPLTVSVGPNTDDAVSVASTVFGSADIPVISPLARSPMFMDVRTYPNLYLMAPNLVQEVRALFSLVQQQQWQRLAVVYSQDLEGQMIANQLPRLVKESGYHLDQIEIAIPADDLGPATKRVVENIRSLKYRVVLLHATERIARLVINEMAGAGMLNGDFILLGTTFWTSSALGESELAFSEAEKAVLGGSVGLRFPVPSGAKWNAFLSNVTAFAPELFPPYHTEPVTMATQNCYDGAMTAITAIVTTVAQGLEPTALNVWKTLDGLAEFEGVDGRVSFGDSGENLPDMLITNFRGDRFEDIGFYRQLTRTDKPTLGLTTPIVWSDGSVGSASGEVPRHLESVPRWAIDLSYAVMAVGLLFNLVLHRTIWNQRGHEIIKASSPLFCHIIIAGSAFTYLMTGLGSISPDNLCRALPGCVAGAFSIIFGCLFAKTWRIHRIFNSRTLSRKAPTSKSLLVIVAVLLSFETLIQIIWMASDLPHAIIVAHPSNPFGSVEVCHSDNMTAWWALSLLPKVLVLLFGIYIAYKVRLLNHNFNEAKHISMAVYNVVIMCILLLPLALLFEKDPTTSYLIRTIGPMITAMVTLCLLFVPKFWDMFITHDWVEYVSDAVYENGVLVHKSSKHSRNSAAGNSQLAGAQQNSNIAAHAGGKAVATKPASGGSAYLYTQGSNSRGSGAHNKNPSTTTRTLSPSGASPKHGAMSPSTEPRPPAARSPSQEKEGTPFSAQAALMAFTHMPNVVNEAPVPEVVVQMPAAQ